MFKKISIAVLSSIVAFSLMAFSPVTPGSSITEALPDATVPAVVSQTDAGLTAGEIAGLLKMREEEKLAHDVYVYLDDTWGQNSFENIASSEQTHMDEIKVLLDAYGLADPATGNPAGVFTDPALQKLYNDLTKQGSESLAAALKVGGAIEEIDILDLREQLKFVTRADIQVVYQNLENGSDNHLRAFSGTLERQTGETYQPKYITGEEYEAIVSSTQGNGGDGHGTETGSGSGNSNGTGTGSGTGTGMGTGSGSGSGHRGGRN
jgi:hypothetical protein